MTVNKCILLGRLGRDPELRHTTNNNPVCNFSLATSEKRGKEEKTEWHQIIVFGQTAVNCSKYLSKGKQVYVEGKLQAREWEDKVGVKKRTTEIVAFSVQFLSPSEQDDGRTEHETNGGRAATPENLQGEVYGDNDVSKASRTIYDEDEDSIPF
jgi:single-strand DNA-binding protein